MFSASSLLTRHCSSSHFSTLHLCYSVFLARIPPAPSLIYLVNLRFLKVRFKCHYFCENTSDLLSAELRTLIFVLLLPMSCTLFKLFSHLVSWFFILRPLEHINTVGIFFPTQGPVNVTLLVNS